MAYVNGVNPQTGAQRLGRIAQPGAVRQQYAGINPQQFASWFGNQNAATQQGLLSPGGGGVQTPWGNLGAEGRTIGLLQQGGMNGNALNQFINNTDANVGYNGGIAGGRNPATVWDFTSGGPYYGGSTAAGAGYGTPDQLGGWSGSDAFNAAHPFNASAYTGGAGTPQSAPYGSAIQQAAQSANPGGGLSQVGGTGGMPPATTAQPNTIGSIANPNAPSYPLNVGAYLNPAAGFAQDWANKGLQGTYAGQGDLLSGAAMRGISDYNRNMAINDVWNPAVQTAQQQQGFGYGVNAADRNFAFQQQLANQTIPFNQQMQLAQLGMQGTQGAAGQQNLLATLQAQLAQALGNAQGTGTIGQNNQITGGLQNALNQWLSNQYLNRILPAGGGS